MSRPRTISLWKTGAVLLSILAAHCAIASTCDSRFPLPPRIVVDVTPYASINAALADREDIDRYRDPARAKGISLAYAATELQSHLSRAGFKTTIGVEPDGHGPVINLQVAPTDDHLGAQGFSLSACDGRVTVGAAAPIGVIYGTYRLLQHLGFGWDDPWETRQPTGAALREDISWPNRTEVPSVAIRGFWIYGDDDVPDAFAIWAARNHFNLAGRIRAPLRQLLGMHGWGGGHHLLQEEFSRPGLFEQHPEWFALINGVRRAIPPSGAHVNPAFANTEAADYFAHRLVARLESGDLRDVDLLNVWPADDRGNVFDQSRLARALGNETDGMLQFLAILCRRLAEARAEGRLGRQVTVVGASYFLSMTPPENASVVASLAREDYLHLFYPLDRSWAGPIDADLGSRDANRRIVQQLEQWRRIAPLRYGVVDYHNMSAYAALGLDDATSYGRNQALWGTLNPELLAYMHPLRTNPGPRRLTNRLLARLTWRHGLPAKPAGERAEEETHSYFRERYGRFADRWRAVHELMSRSVSNAKEMFGVDSLYWVLMQEQLWVPPPYPRAEALAFIDSYRSGGVQDLPTAFSHHPRARASFPGLNQSVRWQEEARRHWLAVLNERPPTAVRRRMQSDIAWFEASASRYRLMVATCDLMEARATGKSTADPIQRMKREIAFLEDSETTRDTLSPVDQREFLDRHKRLLDQPQ